MTKTVVWSAVAKRNIQRIKQFYNDRNKSSAYSKKLLQVFRDAAGVIENQPQIGKNTNFETVRGFIILDYIIFYEELDSYILILMVWDCRRDPAQIQKFLNSDNPTDSNNTDI